MTQLLLTNVITVKIYLTTMRLASKCSLFARKDPTKLTVRRKGIWNISELEKLFLEKASSSDMDSVFIAYKVIHLVKYLLLLIRNLKLCFVP